MCNQDCRKSHVHTECDKQQHHRYTSHNVCVQHRNVGDTQHKGTKLAIPMEAKVPITVAISAERSAMIRVLYKVLMIASSWKRDTYHFPVNPPHLARVLELLKDRTISVMIGA